VTANPRSTDRPANLTVAVLLPTFNGEKYLRQQLDSIAAQTHPPDELLIGDDCSSDATLDIVEAFREQTSLPVSIMRNETNIGLTRNLRRLALAVNSDVIFFSDQDDVWRPQKIETLLSCFSDPHAEAACCDSVPFDSETGAESPKTVWETALRGRRPTASMNVLWRRNFILGHNTAITRAALSECLWPESPDVYYDYWIALVMAAKGTLVLCPQVLTRYRQHGENVVGIVGRRGPTVNIRNWTMTANTLEGVLGHLDLRQVPVPPEVREGMQRRSAFMRERVAYLAAPRRHVSTPVRLLTSREGYFAFGNGFDSFFGDLLALAGRSGTPPARHQDEGGGALHSVPAEETRRLCLGVYADLGYWRDGEGVSSTTAFVSWLARLAEQVDEMVLFGRTHVDAGRSLFPLVTEAKVTFVELPYYQSLNRIRQVARAAPVAAWRWWRNLEVCDAVLIFGPHPFSTVFGLEARARQVPVFVGVRENLANYLSHRTSGWRHRAAAPVAKGLDFAHRRLGKRGAVIVGEEMASRYRAHGLPVLESGVSLLTRQDVVPFEEIRSRAWPGDHVIAVVQRLDPDKNPLLLVDVAEALSTAGSWVLEVAGTGALAEQVASEVDRRGLTNITLRGRVSREEIEDLYRRASFLLHVSFTEGQPQILYEAAAFGLPMVATDVGGVGAALGHGSRGFLVPPGELMPILRAIERLDAEPQTRAAVVEAAWRWSLEETVEAQTANVARFIRANL
jgi:glycosyltransferase involved in cell wall biosynthesis